jgi:hypothetical protein
MHAASKLRFVHRVECVALSYQIRVDILATESKQIHISPKLPQRSAQRDEIEVVRVQKEAIQFVCASKLQSIAANLSIDGLFTTVEAFPDRFRRSILVKPLPRLLKLLYSLAAVLKAKVPYCSRTLWVGSDDHAFETFVVLNEIEDKSPILAAARECPKRGADEIPDKRPQMEPCCVRQTEIATSAANVSKQR